MFVSDRLIYLQLYKTGCTHIEYLLKGLMSCQYHQKHSRIPSDFDLKGRAIVGSIRNPWDWYISLWGFGCDRKGGLYKRLTTRKIKGNGLVGSVRNVSLQDRFRVLLAQINKPIEMWQDVYSDSRDAERFRRWLKMLFSSENKYQLGDGYAISPISSYAGLLSYYYVQLFSRNHSDLFSQKIGDFQKLEEFDLKNNLLTHVIRMEALEDDFLKVMKAIGYEISNEQEQKIRASGKTNSSSRERSIDYYYDRETLDLVAEKERLVIQKYGYQAPILKQEAVLP